MQREEKEEESQLQQIKKRSQNHHRNKQQHQKLPSTRDGIRRACHCTLNNSEKLFLRATRIEDNNIKSSPGSTKNSSTDGSAVTERQANAVKASDLIIAR